MVARSALGTRATVHKKSGSRRTQPTLRQEVIGPLQATTLGSQQDVNQANKQTYNPLIYIRGKYESINQKYVLHLLNKAI